MASFIVCYCTCGMRDRASARDICVLCWLVIVSTRVRLGEVAVPGGATEGQGGEARAATVRMATYPSRHADGLRRNRWTIQAGNQVGLGSKTWSCATR